MHKNLPLMKELLNYHNEKNLILSMPGNKCGELFCRDSIGKEFGDRLGYLDITEVDPLDNLHNPEGVIKEAQELLAKTYNGKKAYFLVNGTTSGNLSAIFAAFEEGDEVLVERNCHKSIYNALILRKLKVVYIEASMDINNNIMVPPTEENISNAINRANDPKGLILTYPNYYGVNFDIEKFLIKLKKDSLKIIIDAAHGAHYGVCDNLPKSLSHVADIYITSAHKTLPALTGGAYLISNCESDIEFYLKAFMTTSPSYLIMASLDYARYYLDVYGKSDYEELVERANRWRDSINELNKVKILSNEDLEEGYSLDNSRYIMTMAKGYSGHKLLKYLRENKIQAEMSFETGVILIFSPSNKEEDFKKLFMVIEKLNIESLKEETFKKVEKILPKKEMELYEAIKCKYEKIDYRKANGKIAKEAIIPYPPGIPIVLPGEVISEEVINITTEYLKNNMSVIGVDSNKVKVII